MPVYELGGVPVQFPYDAYEPQLLYMRTVIEALKEVTFVINHLVYHYVEEECFVRESHWYWQDPLSTLCNISMAFRVGRPTAIKDCQLDGL